jgi:hypothetical protein
MIALSELGSGGWGLAAGTLWHRLAAALLCGVLARTVLLTRRALERRWRKPTSTEGAEGVAEKTNTAA